MKTTTLSRVKPGSAFHYGGTDWIALEHQNGATLALALESIGRKPFDEQNCNDWRRSTLREYLNGEFLDKLCENSAARDVFIEMAIDLTTDDGLTNYGEDHCAVALISCDQYRRFRALIPALDDWWWTVTPWSTGSGESSRFARIVTTSGALISVIAYYWYHGVRPLCNLQSAILVSCDGKRDTNVASQD